MATRYWVGGVGTWNTSATTNWSATSGGTSGASAPGSADDVIFDGNSGTGPTGTTITVTGSPTVASLSVNGRTISGLTVLLFSSGLTVTGTLTVGAGTNPAMRTFFRSDTVGTQRTLTCGAISLADTDLRDIVIAGAASPATGTRLGDCKGNGGVTFDAAKTVYWNLSGSASWSGTAWATSAGGTVAASNFPLAQDTVIFTSTSPASGSTTTVNASYNIGTIDMSARTSNTMTLATGANLVNVYGNWINGTGITLTGGTNLTFAGRGSQTITSAGKTFTQGLDVSSPGGSVTLLDAYTSSRSATSALNLVRGTLDLGGNSFTLSGSASGASLTGTGVRGISFGTGVLTIAGSGNAWSASTTTNLTITGTGTISLTSASAKSFIGGGFQGYPKLNQGGTGALTVTGSNKFLAMTNTAIGSVLFTGGTTNEFTSFDLDGAAGNLLTLGSTNTTQATLKKVGAWNVGANSTDAGNNSGLSFV